MKAQRFPLNRTIIPAVNNQFHASAPAHPNLHQRFSVLSQDPSPPKSRRAETVSKLLDRRWSLLSPVPKIHQILVSKRRQSQPGPLGNFDFSNNACPGSGGAAANTMMVRNNGSSSSSSSSSSFYVVRDDLLHPLVNGNKARKLDGLLPLIEDHSVTDVVTCGGCQSAHAAAVAFSCGERGLRSHLLLRGERPEILTGYNLISTVYGNVTYVPRSVYADREKMLMQHADMLAAGTGSILSCDDILKASFTALSSVMPNSVQMDTHKSHEDLSRRVVIVNEGASSALALLGVIRLVHCLSHNHSLGKERPVKLVVDAGTGTTAVGLGLGAICLGLPWEVIAVTLADTIDGYKKQEKCLISEFKRLCASHRIDHDLHGIDGGTVHWLERSSPRKFGNILEGELEACQHVARQTGVLVDPVYTLAAWELATHMSREESKDGASVVMLHTGGTLGMFGLAQRYKPYFHAL